MSVRSDVAALLVQGLPTARVLDHPVTVDSVEANRPLVLVYRESVRPGLSAHLRANGLVVYVVTPRTSPQAAEDELDGLLDQVLDALEDSEVIKWTEASRTTYADTAWPAYRVTVDIITQKG